MSSRKDANADIIAEFRSRRGQVGGQFAETPLLLLTTHGAQTGQLHTTPLAYRADRDNFVVVAANGGRSRNPDWYLNLLADPAATAEVGDLTVPVRARIAEHTERTLLYDQMAQLVPVFATFPLRTARQIPVVVLERTNAADART